MSSCNDRPYYTAEDCPNCGQKDSPGAWKGARQGNSSWGHNYSCCSDKCGREFLYSKKYFEAEKTAIKLKMEGLKGQYARLCKLEKEKLGR